MHKAFVSAASVVLLVACGDTVTAESSGSIEQAVVKTSNGVVINPANITTIKLTGSAVQEFKNELAARNISVPGHTLASGEIALTQSFADSVKSQPAPVSPATAPLADAGAPRPAQSSGWSGWCASCVSDTGTVATQILKPTIPAAEQFLSHLEAVGIPIVEQFANGVLTIGEEYLTKKLQSGLGSVGSKLGQPVPVITLTPATNLTVTPPK